jgi:PAS domain S-box-containing protein
VVVGFISLGILYYHYEADLIRNDKYEDISAIAKLKVNSIDEWRRYRLADVKRASIGRLVKRDMVRLFQDPTNPSTRASLQIQLDINKKDTVYADTLFLDTKGNILLSDNPNPAPVDQTTMKAIEVALKDRKGVLSDFFRDPEGIIYIDAVAPILDYSGQPIAITVLRSKAADFLYPLIQSWPTPSKTAETLLVCREGDSALFLNELRHRSNTALTLIFPLTDTYLPAAQAVLGKYGKFFGKDYRGVDVLAITQPVPDSSWSIVAKVDADEVLAEVKYRAWAGSIIIFLLILIAAGLIISMYRNRQKGERRKAEKALRESEVKYRALIETTQTGYVIIDQVGLVLDANPEYVRLTGHHDLSEIVSRSVIEWTADHEKEKNAAAVGECFKKGYIRNLEIDYVDSKGSFTPIEINATYMESEGVAQILTLCRDITDRKRAEEALSNSEGRLHTLVQTIPDLIWLKDKDGVYLSCNTMFERFFGAGEADIVGKTDYDFVARELADSFREHDRKAMTAGKPTSNEEWITFADDGHRALLETIKTPMYDARGTLIGVLGIGRDITERKRAEDSLRESEKRLREAQKMAHLGFWYWDVKTGDVEWSEEVFNIFCLDPKEFTPHIDSILALSPWPEDHQRDQELINRAIETHDQGFYEQKFLRPDQSIGYYYSTFQGNYDENGDLFSIVGTVLDITERKQAEDDLKQAEERYRSIFENAQEGIFQTTNEGRYLAANQALATVLGYDSPEDLMTTLIDIPKQLYVNPEDRKVLLKMIEEQGSVRGFETQFYRKSGSMIWGSVNMQAVRDAEGRLLYYEGFNEDITIKRENIERMRKALGATVQAMAMTVETRDPYTAGHQRRVADLSRSIATEMNLPADQIDGIRMAATIHDLGKISVPAEILSKPTKLTALEFSLIKTHPQSGYDILKDIDFPWPVAKIVLEHHERMNGSGYPNGLTGDNLLMESRILAVADVVESMASHRPYRPSLGIKAALEEIEKNRGTLYDHNVTDACLRLFREKGYQLQ